MPFDPGTSGSGRRRRLLARWLGLSAVGAALVAAPDSGERVFSLSSGHGPAWTDLVGTAVLLVAWAPVAAHLVRHPAPRSTAWRVGVGLAVMAAPVLVWSILTDAPTWTWVAAVAVLVVAQVLAVLARESRVAP